MVSDIYLYLNLFTRYAGMDRYDSSKLLFYRLKFSFSSKVLCSFSNSHHSASP